MEKYLQLVWLLLLLSLCFYLWIYKTGKSIESNRRLIKYGIKTKGMVVQYVCKENDDNQTLYYEVIEFYELSGNSRIAERKNGSSERLRLGKEVVVYYDKNDPEKLLGGSSDIIFEFVKLFFGIAACILITFYLLFWW